MYAKYAMWLVSNNIKNLSIEIYFPRGEIDLKMDEFKLYIKCLKFLCEKGKFCVNMYH